jgi:NAD(P)H dehydrogenase (quinone)
MPVTVLVLYHSRHGSVRALAEKIAIGVQSCGAEVMLRTVAGSVDSGGGLHPEVTLAELAGADAVAVGSPVRFGLMSAEMKAFWDSTTPLWLKGSLIDKPAGVFTSSSSMHGGNEATLLGLMLPLLHHGMVLLGVPYDQPALHQTQAGGTPYGPSHVTGPTAESQLHADEQRIAVAFGKRLATIARQLTQAQSDS